MEKRQELSQTNCLNCGTTVQGDFCHQCSQRARDNTDRSLGRLLGEFFSNIFFLDNRFFLSAWFLLRFPSRMTVEFLEGKRKKFISPITLFLFFNLIYFFVNPLSDYSLSLSDQMYIQPYSSWIKEWVDHRLQTKGLDEQSYAITYQNTSDNISKSIMIINIPMIAGFVYLMAFKKRRFYFDSLIFSFHFFSLLMLSWVVGSWVNPIIGFLSGPETSVIYDISFNFWTFFIPLFYAILGIKKFMDIRWYWGLLAGFGVMVGVTLANLSYRFIILISTLAAT